MLKTPTTKQQRLQLVNLTVAGHDLMCTCNEPALHSLHIIIDQLKPELSPENINQLQKCLGETGTNAADDFDIDTGDLEQLFGEDDAADTEDANR